MGDGADGERRWLRPLGLFLLAMALGVGQPSVVMIVAFAMMVVLTRGGGTTPLVIAAVAFAFAFAGDPRGGMWYLDRGWAILVGGWFAAGSWGWPARPFLERALAAVAGGSLTAVTLLIALGGWVAVEWLVVERLHAGVAAAHVVLAAVAGGELDGAVLETMQRATEVQGILFPGLLGLSTVAALGVAWWLHVRVTTGSDRGLGPLREFRFPDPLVWVLIAGLALVLMTEWNAGWGRVGSNLVTFMGALYVLRGAGVLLFLAGGVSVIGGVALFTGMLLAGPVLVAGAFVVGMGDSWMDLRSRFGDGRSGS